MSAAGDGMERLLSAVFQGDEPSPELLASYASDPLSLSPEQRSEIERALKTRLDLADEVRTLRSFRRPDAAAPPRRRLRGLRRWRGLPVWVRVAASVALLSPLTPAAWRWIEGSGSVPTSTAELAPEPVSDVLSPSETRPEIAKPAEPVERSELIAEVRRPPTRDRAAEAPVPSPSAPPPAREQVAELELAPVVDPPPAPPVADHATTPMLQPSYRRPPEAVERRRMVVAMRGATPGGVSLEALAPEHVALTRRALPHLFWKLSGTLPEAAKLLFRLVEERSGETLVERELPLPEAPGVQRVTLSDQGVMLEPGIVYTWFIVLRMDPENPARDLLAQGWIQRRETELTLSRESEALPAELAQAGLWYDALAAALDVRIEGSSDASVERAVQSLLEQAGLPPSLEP